MKKIRHYLLVAAKSKKEMIENPIKIGTTVIYKGNLYKVEGPKFYDKLEPWLFIVGGNPQRQVVVDPSDVKIAKNSNIVKSRK